MVNNIHDGVLSNQTNMRPGFIITKVGDMPVKTIDEFKKGILANKTAIFKYREFILIVKNPITMGSMISGNSFSF